MSDAYGEGLGRERDSRGASAARRLAAEIVPKWSGASAANTMEYETALRAIMVEGHGPVEGLLAAVYFGDVDETKEGYLKYQLLRLGAGSQGTAKQNRTEQTKAQKQEKHTRTDKALSAEQAADFGMWQQSSAAPAC
jgi:hypothetical protein